MLRLMLIVPLFSVLLSAWVAGSAQGDSPATRPPVPAKGQQAVSFYTGYGSELGLRDLTEGWDVRDIRYVPIIVGWSIGLSDLQAPEWWVRGTWELGVEGSVLFNTEPDFGVAGGVTLNLRYYFLTLEKLAPYLEGGLGLGGNGWGLESQADGFTFFTQVGVGVRWQVSQRWALTGSWRYHHLSNASIKLPNLGIDASLFLVGVTWLVR